MNWLTTVLILFLMLGLNLDSTRDGEFQRQTIANQEKLIQILERVAAGSAEPTQDPSRCGERQPGGMIIRPC